MSDEALFSTVHMDARISADGRYRYTLTRLWDPALPILTLVMLNPSTADAFKNDPTITRGIGFARDLEHGGLNVVNAYAWRATKPAELWTAVDPIGPENDDVLRAALAVAHKTGGLVIAAWGKHCLPLRAGFIQVLADTRGVQLHALGVNKNGSPKHPLYIAAGTRPQPWRWNG